MMRTPSYDALCSSIYSIILTSALIPATGNVQLAAVGTPAVQAAVQSALNGLRAQGFAGGSEFALPSPGTMPPAALGQEAPIPSATSVLPPELLAKIITLISIHGGDSQTPARFASALGLGTEGTAWLNHQEAANESNSGWLHTFAISRGNDQDILLTVRRPTLLLAFRAQRDGTVLNALRYDIPTGKLTIRIPAETQEAQADFEVECAFWAANVDSLISQK